MNQAPPAVETRPVIKADPLMNAESAAIPSWLQVPKTDEVVVPHIEESIPVIAAQEDTPAIETPAAPTTETTESTVPDWLQVTDAPVIETQAPVESVLSDDVLVPDQDLTPTEPIIATPEPSSDALPDWLVDSLKSPETTPITETVEKSSSEVAKPEKKKRPKKIETKKEVPPTTSTTATDIPDWLK